MKIQFKEMNKMKIKSTSELLKELSATENFDEFAKENKDYMISKSLSEHLCELLIEKKLKKSEVIKKSEISSDYAYQIFSGTKSSPNRDKLISIAIGMGLSVDETSGLLKLAGLMPLYAKNMRDSIIIFGINNSKEVCEINEMLFDKNESTMT